MSEGELEPFVSILHELCAEQSLDPFEMAAALAKKAQGKVPLLLKDVVIPARQPGRPRPERATAEPGMACYRLAVGHVHGVNPNHIVGAIANESGLHSRHIGRIRINEDHSLVDLPEGMPQRIFRLLKKIRVCQVPMKLSLVSGQPPRTKQKSFRHKALNHKRRAVSKR